MENVRNHRDIKLVTSEKKNKTNSFRTKSPSCKKFSHDLMAIEMKKNKSKNE